MAGRNNIQCANCRAFGHVSRVCPHPVSSFGIICYRFDEAKKRPEYLMVQRKDSLCYVEFMLGKYKIDNAPYLCMMFSSMTIAERERLLTDMSFEDLWKDLWQVQSCNTYMKEYYDAHRKFHALRAGFEMEPGAKPWSIARLVAETHTDIRYDEPEWGFPKGRRNLTETDVACALREFAEETGLTADHVVLRDDLRPVEETFTGSNHQVYRHMYFIARVHPDAPRKLPVLSVTQRREIRQTAWWPCEDVQKRIRPINAERRRLFDAVHASISVTMPAAAAATPQGPAR